MEINKELLERYHNGTSTAEEKAAVEAWLQDDTFDDTLVVKDMPVGIGHEMWADIASFVDEKPKAKTRDLFSFKKIAAAAMLLLVAGAIFYKLPKQADVQSVSVSNSSNTEVKNINYADYSVTMAPNSNLNMDAKTGMLRFCGSLLFSPKNDMEVSFAGLKQKVKLKTGQTYIVLSTNCPSDKPIIINEKDVYNLPPVMQRQLSNQFSI